MTFTINGDIIRKHMSVESFFYLLPIYFKKQMNKETLEELKRKFLIIISEVDFNGYPIDPKLTNDAIKAIESIFLDSENQQNNASEDRFTILAEKLREIFPTGKKPGTNLYWRESISLLPHRLKIFIKKFGDFTDDQIINAAKNYISSFNGDYSYMQILKYFIYKNVNDGDTIEIKSQLLNYIENEDSEEVNQNWTSELK